MITKGDYIPSSLTPLIVNSVFYKGPLTGNINLGINNVFRSTGSIITGQNNIVVLPNNIVIGNKSNILGQHNTVAGEGHNVLSDHNIVAGFSHSVSGEYNLVNGSSHSVSANYNIVFGQKNNDVSTQNNIVNGEDNEISGIDGRNLVIGKTNNIKSDFNMVVGVSNLVDDTSTNNNILGDSHQIVNASYNLISGVGHIVGITSSITNNNFVSGNNHRVKGQYNTVLGNNNAISHTADYNLVMGKDSTIFPDCANNVVIGKNNNLTTVNKSNNFIVGDNHNIGHNSNYVFGGQGVSSTTDGATHITGDNQYQRFLKNASYSYTVGDTINGSETGIAYYGEQHTYKEIVRLGSANESVYEELEMYSYATFSAGVNYEPLYMVVLNGSSSFFSDEYASYTVENNIQGFTNDGGTRRFFAAKMIYSIFYDPTGAGTSTVTQLFDQQSGETGIFAPVMIADPNIKLLLFNHASTNPYPVSINCKTTICRQKGF